MKFKDGSIYQGDFYNDKQHGTGTFIYQDGKKYVGLWKHGLKHGRGKYWGHGKPVEGIWEHGDRVQTD